MGNKIHDFIRRSYVHWLLKEYNFLDYAAKIKLNSLECQELFPIVP